MKEIILWVILYGVYWFVSCVLGNCLSSLTNFDWINDITRTVGPFVFLGIIYIILKLINKTKGKNQKVKVCENKLIINSLKVLGICIGAFLMAIVLMMLYAIFTMFIMN